MLRFLADYKEENGLAWVQVKPKIYGVERRGRNNSNTLANAENVLLTQFGVTV